MTDSLNQIINDINTGKQNKGILVQQSAFKNKKKSSRKSIPNYQFQIQLKKLDNSKRNSFMEDNNDINNLNKNNASTPFKNKNEKNTKNINNNVKNIKKNHLFVVENVEKKKRKSFEDFPTNNIAQNFNISINTTPNKTKIGRFFSLENTNFKINMNSFKKNGPFNLLQQIIEDNMSKNGTYKENKDNKENEKNQKSNDKNNINYKKLLNKNFNKSKFYFMDIKNLFLKNEIYINIYKKSMKRSQTETDSPTNHKKNINRKKTNLINNKNKIYTITKL
jgi:hypothetical protein